MNSRMGMLFSAGCGVLLSGSSGVFIEALMYYQSEIACVCDNYPMFGLYMCLWSPSRGKNLGTFKNLVTWSMNGPTPGPSRLLNF